ncbi:putative metal-dependent peptidase [Thiogranum longum]|uniref:Putative metal-dependent peptidase n=1 Tax=Thiogranum longum TaxID=1537524 RepID=A0A4R1HHN5_9GAMM|nr:VWA-like domain-containing protein [Thiogranum longum]TCK18919.1 putative metal-dependent peptidase [Thiogranum longum]
MSDDIETKLSAARTRLILDRPFLGALVLRLPMHATKPERCRTIGTDVRALYYNPEYISQLSLDQTQFVLAHEALHCALSHFARRQHRVKQRWDVACDLAINPLLIQDGLKPPPGVLLRSGFEGMMAEEIYPFIEEDTEEETHDDHLYDQENNSKGSSSGGSSSEDDSRSGDGSSQDNDSEPEQGGQPQPLSETEQEQLAVQWRQRLAGAAQQAKQAGKLGAAMMRLVDHLLQPQLPWRMLLARYMTAAARDDYSYQRPSRREGDAILPTLKSAQVNVAVVLDTSGSVNDTEMMEFVTEIDAIKGQIRARLMLHACDAALCKNGPWIYEPWEAFTLPEGIYGRGGTRFVPVFEWLDHIDQKPDLLVYFTDAQGEFPKTEPAYPVLWLVKGKAKVPWGQRIQLN